MRDKEPDAPLDFPCDSCGGTAALRYAGGELSAQHRRDGKFHFARVNADVMIKRLAGHVSMERLARWQEIIAGELARRDKLKRAA